jgi:phage baseplate assembly protein W
VALQYIAEKWTIRDSGDPFANHVAESIANILLTHPMENDTLPPFGSKMQEGVFEPNTTNFRLLYTFYLENSTEAWEKRAQIPKGGVTWQNQPYLTDQGELPLNVTIQFITSQVAGNLVAPFVTPLQARSQLYPPIQLDSNNHDYYSRYFNQLSFSDGGNNVLRVTIPKVIPPAPDDQFYRTKYRDSWLLISWRLYGDIRFWNVIAQTWVQDSAASGGTRDCLNITDPPVMGTVLRAPSKTRLLTHIVTQG